MLDENINVSEQVNLILDIANQLRGPFKEDEYQNVIIPMTICRRFECILSKTKDKVVEAFNNGVTNEKRLKYLSGFSIYNTSEFTLKTLLDEPSKIETNFKDYLENFSDSAKEIFIQMDFFKTIEKMSKGKKIYPVIKKFANTDLSTDHVTSMQMGYIMEEIIRTYSENASAGDHFTPREVIRCLTKLLLAEGCDDLFGDGKIVTLGDYACGTGGMLSEGYRLIKQLNSSTDVELFGQDNNGWYEGIAEAEMIIKGQNPEHMKLVESTLTTDAFPENPVRLLLMNPPFGLNWSKDKIGTEQYEKILAQNKSTGWFPAGLPSSNDGQMLFWQFAMHKLDSEKGRGAIICNGSPLFGVNASESNIRKWLLDNDWIEAIIEFCPELFYNTGIGIYTIIFNKNKSAKRKNKIQLIDASSFCKRMNKGLGYKRNELTPAQIDEIVKIYSDFKENEYCKIFEKEDFYSREIVVNMPYRRNFCISKERINNLFNNISFNKLYDEDKYLEIDGLPSKTQAQLDLLSEYKKGKELQQKIVSKLEDNADNVLFKNRDKFQDKINKLFPELKDSKSLLKGIVSSLSQPDSSADCYYDKKGRIEFDSDLRFQETIPLKEDIDEFFEREIRPFAPEAVMDLDPNNIRISCEINFNKYFYTVTLPKKSLDILDAFNSKASKENSLISEINSFKQKIDDISDERIKLKFITKQISSGGTPDSSNSTYYCDENGYNWMTIADMVSGNETRTINQLTRKGLVSKKLDIYPAGTLLYSIYATIGRTYILPYDSSVNQAILAIMPYETYDTKYLKFALDAKTNEVLREASTSTQANLSMKKVSNFKVPQISLDDQKIIADDLEGKVKTIDDLIDLYSNKIEDLKALKESVIFEHINGKRK